MHQDIQKIKKETNGDKIITKHEWMIAAISILEKDLDSSREESLSKLYEVLFIDPTKLTPYQ